MLPHKTSERYAEDIGLMILLASSTMCDMALKKQLPSPTILTEELGPWATGMVTECLLWWASPLYIGLSAMLSRRAGTSMWPHRCALQSSRSRSSSHWRFGGRSVPLSSRHRFLPVESDTSKSSVGWQSSDAGVSADTVSSASETTVLVGVLSL